MKQLPTGEKAEELGQQCTPNIDAEMTCIIWQTMAHTRRASREGRKKLKTGEKNPHQIKRGRVDPVRHAERCGKE